MPMIDLDGLALAYTEQGRGPAVLLLHGLGSSGRDWELQFPALTGRYRVWTLDMRGHGQSDRPLGGYSIPQMAHDTTVFIDQISIAPVVLLGVSMGGMIALEVAANRPELVSHLIVVNAVHELVPKTPWQRFAVWRRLFIARRLGMKRLGQFLARRMFPEPHQVMYRRLMESRWVENDQRAYLAALQGILGWRLSKPLGAIRCPTLVVSGEQDFIPLHLKQTMAERLPDARLTVIPNSRHVTPVDQAARFNARVLSFLSETGL